MREGRKADFVSIPRHKAVLNWLRLPRMTPGGIRTMVVVGIKAHCLDCNQSWVGTPSQHSQALAWVHSHSCKSGSE